MCIRDRRRRFKQRLSLAWSCLKISINAIYRILYLTTSIYCVNILVWLIFVHMRPPQHTLFKIEMCQGITLILTGILWHFFLFIDIFLRKEEPIMNILTPISTFGRVTADLELKKMCIRDRSYTGRYHPLYYDEQYPSGQHPGNPAILLFGICGKNGIRRNRPGIWNADWRRL